MRILIATTAGAGHFAALAPFVRAYQDAGNDVRVAAPMSFEASVAGAGVPFVPLADPPHDEMGAIFARLPSLSLEEANTVIVRDVLAGLDARAALPAMQEVVDAWKPDVVSIAVAALEDLFMVYADESLRALGAQHGIEGLRRAPGFTLVPGSLERGDAAPIGSTYRYRHESAPSGAGQLPADYANAQRVQAIGAGLAMEGPAAAVGVREALERVLREPHFRHAAEHVVDEIRADSIPPFECY